ncbi:enoyl-CoA hydratase/isomerase family protein [Streptomyces muensis]|uniref:Enoyl-CoA hydratase/isomerase family protein n=1 Tax=Streptomyces muensis TaxID=1077944 RepID=A0A9X1PVK2_STRM4|nr:enoyl-CoA hydratase/isomerase family protein [Streptomyces muensis]MCF1592533.1 enoyl-CoA hydratase/isomerase family protein [Streptomyces muensis]
MTDVAARQEPLAVLEGEGFQTWTMNNAPVNALSPQLLDRFESAIGDIVDRDDIACVVLASDLRVFSAGADAAWMAGTLREAGMDGLIDRFNESMDRFREICERLRGLPVLVIAAIDGHALAGGLELAVACDLRIAGDAEKVQIGVPEMDLFGAMPSGGGGVQFLSRLMGPAAALRFVLDGKPVTPVRAAELRIVEQVVPAGTARAEAERFAAEVARKAGRIGVHAAKRAVFAGATLPLGEALAYDREIHWDAMRRGNFRRGAQTFVEQFGGRG